MRMVKRGVSALITDGVMRDKHGVLGRTAGLVRRRCGSGFGQPADLRRLERPIGCGGCAIFPTTSSSRTTTAR